MDNLEKPKGLDERIIVDQRAGERGDRIVRDAIADLLLETTWKRTDIISRKISADTEDQAIDECEHIADALENVVIYEEHLMTNLIILIGSSSWRWRSTTPTVSTTRPTRSRPASPPGR